MSSFRHGRGGYTNHGCRCSKCTAAQTQHMRRWRAAAAATAPAGWRHGSVATYTNYGCRCEPCTTANTAAVRDWRARQRATS